jgi:hypothetical protein
MVTSFLGFCERIPCEFMLRLVSCIYTGWIGDYGCYSIATSQSVSDAEQQESDKETEAQAENSSTSLLNTT